MLLSITIKSPSSNPALIIDSPETLAKKVASLFFINSLSKLILSCLKSPAGDGKPADIPAFIKIASSLLSLLGIKKFNFFLFFI